MMFPLGRKKRCARRNPRLGALLGLLSALMIGGAGYLERYKGEHEWLILGAMICLMLVGLGLVRLVVLNQDER
jgi:hypothetical protein